MRLARGLVAVVAALGAVAVGVVGLPGPAYAADDPVIVIKADHLEGEHTVPFHMNGFAPGDTRSATVVLRNDANRTAQIVYAGARFGTGSLGKHVWLSIRHDGVELARGRADSERLDGTRFQVGAGATTRLRIELTMPKSEGNDAQGTSMRVLFTFSISGGAAPIETGVPGTAAGTALPPTGESLATFHALVWAALGAFAAALLGFFLMALRRREDEEQVQPLPLTIFDDDGSRASAGPARTEEER